MFEIVLIFFEDIELLKKLVDGLVKRYSDVEKIFLEVFYIDRDCCLEYRICKMNVLFVDWKLLNV